MVRNKKYSLVAKTDGSGAALTRYKGPFDGDKLEEGKLTDKESKLKKEFETTLTRLAKSRLASVSEEVRTKIEKAEKKQKNKKTKN